MPRTLREATERLDTWLDGILDTPAHTGTTG
jgi:hypothetical protein